MSRYLDTERVIKGIDEGEAARHLVLDIINGVNTWLFQVLSEYQLGSDQAKVQCLRFGGKILSHLRMIYELERYYFPPEKGRSFKEYLETDLRAAQHGLNYLVKSVRNGFKDNKADYEAAVVALLITARREEQEFEAFRQGLPKTDLRKTLADYYFQNDERLLGGNGTAPKCESLAPTETVFDARVAFRGFNP